MFLHKSGVVLLIVFSLSLFQFSATVDIEDDEREIDDLFRQTFKDWPSSLSVRNVPTTLSDDNTETTDREKEELSPDFIDPKGTTKDVESATKKPSSKQPDFGIIDIPAGGIPHGFMFGGHSPSIPTGGDSDEDAVGSVFNNIPFTRFPGGSFFDLFGRNPMSKPWWDGPNVCTEKEEIIESPEVENKDTAVSSVDDFGASLFGVFGSTINFSSCSQTATKYECVTKTGSNGGMKTFIVKKKCCHGYQRKAGEGCVKLDLHSAMDTCKDLAGEEFLSVVRSTGMVDKLDAENITVFVPSDAAMKIFDNKMLELNEVDLSVAPSRRRRDAKSSGHSVSSKDLVLSHIVPKIVELNDLSNEDKLYSEYDNSTIHINIYPTPSDELLMTANCVPITKKDNMATNGIVHVLDGVLPPVTQSISKIIAESGKFTILTGILQKTGLDKFLDENKVFTLFAPNDAAFEKLKPELRAKFMKGDGCAKNILKHHILTHALCSNAIQANGTTHNADGIPIFLQRKDGKLTVEKASQVIEPDVIATNGIIQVIDTVLIPESGMDASEIMTKHNLTKYQKLIADADLMDMFNDLSNVTFIVPTDQAIDDAAEELEKIKADKTKMQDFIMYHTIKGELKSCDFNNDVVVDSGLPDQKLRFNLYNTIPLFKSIYNRVTINCAKVTNIDDQACGSVIHEISKVLVPPTQSVLEMLRGNSNYSKFVEFLSGTKLEDELKAANGTFTVLAPTNDAFEALPDKVLERFANKDQADTQLRVHILPEVVCCSGVGYQQFPFTEKVQTMGTFSLTQGHDSHGRVRFSDASVTKCDSVGTNGIVHSVNKLILPTRRSVNPFADLNAMLFNF